MKHDYDISLKVFDAGLIFMLIVMAAALYFNLNEYAKLLELL